MQIALQVDGDGETVHVAEILIHARESVVEAIHAAADAHAERAALRLEMIERGIARDEHAQFRELWNGERHPLSAEPSNGRGTTALRRSAALRIAAVETRHAAIEHDRRGRVALTAELRAFGECALCERVLLPVTRLEVLALLRDELALLG